MASFREKLDDADAINREVDDAVHESDSRTVASSQVNCHEFG